MNKAFRQRLERLEARLHVSDDWLLLEALWRALDGYEDARLEVEWRIALGKAYPGVLDLAFAGINGPIGADASVNASDGEALVSPPNAD